MTSPEEIFVRIKRISGKVRARGFRLNPTLGTEDVNRFETRHCITLPAGYRSFLLSVGNGGLGPPSYGLTALDEPADDMRGEEARFWSELPHVRDPFPFTRFWVWETGEISTEGTIEQARHGSICVGNDGCGMYWHVIVTGPERGNVWMICGEGTQPTAPKRDFLQWYEDWLDGMED
jgi:hypothetical protein